MEFIDDENGKTNHFVEDSEMNYIHEVGRTVHSNEAEYVK